MKYVITGGAGNISKPLALQLLKAGHEVTVIGRNEANLQTLVDAGAETAIGSVEDVPFLTTAFKGADAVYLMIPPKWDAADWKQYIGNVGKGYASAVKESRVKNVLVLSSIGAHLPEGCGPVTGLHLAEEALNTLDDVNIKYLRPAYFYQNLLSNISLIKHAGIIGDNFAVEPNRFPIVHTDDIADAAAEELLQLNFKGHSVRYIASDEISTDAIASEIGKAIEKTGLPWVKFKDEEAYNGMLQGGLTDEVAKNYVEMGVSVNNGKMFEEYWNNKPAVLGKVKLADFAKDFAFAYHS